MSETTLIAVLSPLLLTAGGIISWFIKAKREESLNAEAKSREFKIETYKKLLEPFIGILTTTLTDEEHEKEVNKIGALDYKKAAFDLTTFGSDSAVKAFNNIMQTFYNAEKYKNPKDPKETEYGIRLLSLLSEFLLQIRKDIYSKKTKLKRSDTMEFLITDIDKYRDRINEYKL